MENYATTMPAFRPGTTLRAATLQNASVRIQPMADAVPSLAGVSLHDAVAKSGPPRGEPR